MEERRVLPAIEIWGRLRTGPEVLFSDRYVASTEAAARAPCLWVLPIGEVWMESGRSNEPTSDHRFPEMVIESPKLHATQNKS